MLIFCLTNATSMDVGWAAQAVVTMAFGALGALMGAVVLWKFWALPKISGWITNEGSTKLRAWLKHVIEDPAGEDAAQIGKLTGVAMSYALQGIEELATTEEGQKRLAPLLEIVQGHIEKSIFATWGHILRKLQESGSEIAGGAGGELGLPPEALGMASKLIPKSMRDAGISVPQIIQLAQMLSRLGGGGGNGGAGPASATAGQFSLR